jgi:hypothetical protein
MTQETKMAMQTTTGSDAGFRPPRPKPGLHVTPPSFLRQLRRSIGGTVAYLASWWRY